jgi:hypothetical protein
MNNPRLKGIVNTFGDNYNLGNDFPKKYEIFVNYLFVKKIFFETNKEYPFESSLDIDILSGINFGKNSTLAIDGCIIIHEKKIIHLGLDSDDIDEKLNEIQRGDINVVLIQTKSGKFETTDLSTLSDCLNSNFTYQAEWAKFVEFKSKLNFLIEQKPQVNIKAKIIYVSNPIDLKLFNNDTFKVRENALRQALKNYFWIRNDNSVVIEYYNDQTIYDEYENQSKASLVVCSNINFVEISPLVQCNDYGAIAFGVVKIGELMKILYNSELQKDNELYGYNVRDAIKDSTINTKIKDSISNNGDMFLLLNNGVTIVVDKYERRGERGMYLENIRIVNGCQTCHSILTICKNKTDYNNINVAIRIVETQNENISGKITYSSNNQNPVSKENLFAIEPKIFELEKSYKDFFVEHYQKNLLKKVLLERRQGQFNNTSELFIDMLAQAKAYISLWDKEPHNALRYRDEQLNKYKGYIENGIFVEKSLFCGILWFQIIREIPLNYFNGRFQIFTCVGLDVLNDIFKVENVYNYNFSDINDFVNNLHNKNFQIKTKVQLACLAIDNLPNNFPKLTSGKIHYRKFYPADALSKMWNKYIELKNYAPN